MSKEGPSDKVSFALSGLFLVIAIWSLFGENLIFTIGLGVLSVAWLVLGFTYRKKHKINSH